MAVIKYSPDTRTVTCRLFEPHASKGDAIPAIDGLRTFIYKSLIYCGDLPKVEITSPWHKYGLQGDAPICVQWSTLMFFTYMLTCEVYGECVPSLTKTALKTLWNLRTIIMPVWMYYMDLSIPNPSATDTLLDPDFTPGSEIDMYRCAEQTVCVSPCEEGVDGKCFNANLFKRQRVA
jgi:hypothetical protein